MIVLTRPKTRLIRVDPLRPSRRSSIISVEEYERERRAARRRCQKPRLMSPMLVNPYLGAAGGGGGAPDPLPVAGAILWLAPDYQQYTDAGTTLVSADGDKLYQWNDQSGNAYHAVQTVQDADPNNGKRPTYAPGTTYRSKATVRFGSSTGASRWFQLPNALGTALNSAGAAEMFVAFKNLTPNTGGTVTQRSSWKLGTAGSSFLLWENGHIYEGFGTNSRKEDIDPGQDLSDAFSVYDVWSAANDYGILLDSVSKYTSGSNTVAFVTSDLRFGDDASAHAALTAYVSEVVIFPFKLDSTQRGDMYTYLTP